MTPDEFLDAIVPAARACHEATGIPASFTIAQAALESGWGKSRLSREANNLFGVKANARWKGPVISMLTGEHVKGKDIIEQALWRKYQSWAACLADRSVFFRENKRYAKCFNETTGEGWANAVAAAGYATDVNYAKKLIAMIHSRNLTRFDNVKAKP